jgi:hypothetical protein
MRSNVMARRAPQPPAPAHWRFPEQLVGQGTKLFTQQCWNWGCDVRRQAGNLLRAYGFRHQQRPTTEAGSSSYTLAPAADVQLRLWSFGLVWHTPAGSLFLDRYRFAPRLLRMAELPPAVWRPEQLLHRLGAEADRALIADLLGATIRAIVDYEQWVFTQYGYPYRYDCLMQWSRRALALPVEALAPSWDDFARACALALTPPHEAATTGEPFYGEV